MVGGADRPCPPRAAGDLKGRCAVSRSRPLGAELPHPRAMPAFFGHAAAERTLLEAYGTGRMPHAWIIGGPPGIGKATLAYRLARFVLTHPNSFAQEVQSATSLAVPHDHPVVRRIAAQAHPDLLTLERTPGPTGTLRTVITVDEV